MAVKLTFDGLPGSQVNELADAILSADGCGRIVLSGEVVGMAKRSGGVSVELGGDVELKICPPADPLVAELLR